MSISRIFSGPPVYLDLLTECKLKLYPHFYGIYYHGRDVRGFFFSI